MANHFSSTYYGGTLWRRVEGAEECVLQISDECFLPVRAANGNLGALEPFTGLGIVWFSTEQDAWRFWDAQIKSVS